MSATGRSRVLAGDIGEAHARLTYFHGESRRPTPLQSSFFPSREFGGFAEVVERFVDEEVQRVTRACFGVVGPVQGGRANAPNLPWLVDSRDLSRVLGLDRLTILFLCQCHDAADSEDIAIDSALSVTVEHIGDLHEHRDREQTPRSAFPEVT